MNASFTPKDEPRRRHKRFSPHRSQITCVPRGFWTSVVRRKNVALRLKDLSLGGAQIVASCALTPGTKTDLTIEFAGFLYPVLAEADIRWCRRDTLSLEPRWMAGLTFKRLSPAHESQLRDVDRTYVGVQPPS